MLSQPSLTSLWSRRAGADVVLNGVRLSSLNSVVARQATDHERLDLALTKISKQATKMQATYCTQWTPATPPTHTRRNIPYQ